MGSRDPGKVKQGTGRQWCGKGKRSHKRVATQKGVGAFAEAEGKACADGFRFLGTCGTRWTGAAGLGGACGFGRRGGQFRLVRRLSGGGSRVEDREWNETQTTDCPQHARRIVGVCPQRAQRVVGRVKVCSRGTGGGPVAVASAAVSAAEPNSSLSARGVILSFDTILSGRASHS